MPSTPSMASKPPTQGISSTKQPSMMLSLSRPYVLELPSRLLEAAFPANFREQTQSTSEITVHTTYTYKSLEDGPSTVADEPVGQPQLLYLPAHLEGDSQRHLTTLFDIPANRSISQALTPAASNPFQLTSLSKPPPFASRCLLHFMISSRGLSSTTSSPLSSPKFCNFVSFLFPKNGQLRADHTRQDPNRKIPGPPRAPSYH